MVLLVSGESLIISDSKTVTYKETDSNGEKLAPAISLSTISRKPRSQSLQALSGSKKPIRPDVDVFKSTDKDRGFYSDALMKVIQNLISLIH